MVLGAESTQLAMVVIIVILLILLIRLGGTIIHSFMRSLARRGHVLDVTMRW